MKTLDEVIKGMEDCQNMIVDCEHGCPMLREGEPECDKEQLALHYLKEYRDHQQRLLTLCDNYGDAISNCHQAENKYRKMEDELNAIRREFVEKMKNDPLTWDEVKQMIGKPVWVEYNFQIIDKKIRDNSKRWCIVREFEPWHDTEIIITENGFVLSKNEQVKGWQAYRKERE